DIIFYRIRVFGQNLVVINIQATANPSPENKKYSYPLNLCSTDKSMKRIFRSPYRKRYVVLQVNPRGCFNGSAINPHSIVWFASRHFDINQTVLCKFPHCHESVQTPAPQIKRHRHILSTTRTTHIHKRRSWQLPWPALVRLIV